MLLDSPNKLFYQQWLSCRKNGFLVYDQKNTYLKEYIFKRIHSQKNAYSKEYIAKRIYSKKNTYSKNTVKRIHIQKEYSQKNI